MGNDKKICLLNDSFPPSIDGVANAVVNYAGNLTKAGNRALVVVPDYPDCDDSKYPFEVVRYPSIDLRKHFGYTAGIPFMPKTLRMLGRENIGLLHSHCPIASNYLARNLREELNVPLIMTYHTKFDVDIANLIRGKVLQFGLVKALVESVSAVDELWVVSKGAGENIRKLGYEGEYIVMPNGVDMPRVRAGEEEILKMKKKHGLISKIPVFLFVGRLMWYKGIRIILDALRALKSQNIDFKMVFIGGGGDEEEIKKYVSELKLDDKCIFTGPVYDRNEIRVWYSLSDLFLFPSSFDTNGLVVREAAACSLGTVMLEGSCAAEGVTNGRNGLFIEENAASLAACLVKVMGNPNYLKELGENASRELYMSWEDAVSLALKRYEIVMDNYACGKCKRRKDITDEIFSLYGNLIDIFSEFHE